MQCVVSLLRLLVETLRKSTGDTYPRNYDLDANWLHQELMLFLQLDHTTCISFLSFVMSLRRSSGNVLNLASVNE